MMNKAGLQVFNTNGELILDSTNRVLKVLGEFTAQIGEEQYIIDNNIVGKRIAIILTSVENVRDGTSNANCYPTKFNIEGNKISWEYLGRANFRSDAGVPESYSVYKTTYMYGWY